MDEKTDAVNEENVRRIERAKALIAELQNEFEKLAGEEGKVRRELLNLIDRVKMIKIKNYIAKK